MEKARFYLVRLPVISIVIFFFCCIIAAIIYPGSHKEIIEYESEMYSFTHNFLSELGSLKTNTDETNRKIIHEDNTPSMILFNGSLILIGATLMLFYVEFKKIFTLIKDSYKARLYAKITLPVGLLAGFFLCWSWLCTTRPSFCYPCVFCKFCFFNPFFSLHTP